MRIGIVEDELEAAKNLQDAITKWGQETKTIVTMTVYGTGEEFLAAYKKQFDLIYLDIQMPGISGLETAEKLRELDSKVFLIFLTNMAQFAIDGYKYSAQDYFVKPFSYYALKMRMDRIRETLLRNQDVNVVIPMTSGMVNISAKKLFYIESDGHDTIFHTANGTYTTRDKSMKQLEKELYPYNFRRCNVSYLVNLKHCAGIHENDLFIAGDVLAISRAKRKQFMYEMSQYLSGGSI